MHFLAPSLLLGLLAALLPAIIHRIGRRHARPVRFAAMELLLRAEHEVSARRRLRDALLLVARTGLAMALPLAFARPFAEVRSDLPAVTGRSCSASSARTGGARACPFYSRCGPNSNAAECGPRFTVPDTGRPTLAGRPA